MGKYITGKFIRDTAIGLIIAVGGAVIVKYSDLPARVSVIENSQNDIKDAVKSVDAKLDIVLQRLDR